jgi:hypothetical protein
MFMATYKGILFATIDWQQASKYFDIDLKAVIVRRL